MSEPHTHGGTDAPECTTCRSQCATCSDRCLNCNAPIEQINYAMGPKWMHVDPSASFPSQHKGTAWWHCKTAIAEPKEATR